VAVFLLLVYEHSLVSARDLSNLNAAFFTMNGIIAVVFFLFLAIDLHFHVIAKKTAGGT
jgi:4-hydroxybenzoate polyprenyltransferase